MTRSQRLVLVALGAVLNEGRATIGLTAERAGLGRSQTHRHLLALSELGLVEGVGTRQSGTLRLADGVLVDGSNVWQIRRVG